MVVAGSNTMTTTRKTRKDDIIIAECMNHVVAFLVTVAVVHRNHNIYLYIYVCVYIYVYYYI